MCARYGMTEEQFWKANPRIIAVHEQIYKERQNRINDLAYLFTGNYGLSALITSIDKVLNGKKSKEKYMDKPLELFPLTEEEKKKKQQDAIKQFISWTGMAETKYKGKEDKNG